MVAITLPDNSQKTYDAPVTVLQVAESIGPGLAKAALAGKVNGELVDVSHLIDSDSNLSIITGRDEDGLDVIRHSCAHLMANAVQNLFPEAQVTIGPVIENGFFYDFSYERPFTPEDLSAIEKEMQRLSKANIPVERSVMSRADAVALFNEMGEKYKVEIIESIPGDEALSFYKQGEFVDLCRGPHVPATGAIRSFKLMSVAGAYWRGDSNNPMLQRIYGTAWNDKKSLKQYLSMLEEAESATIASSARNFDLVSYPGRSARHGVLASQGLADLADHRAVHANAVQNNGYQEINTPQMVDYVTVGEVGSCR